MKILLINLFILKLDWRNLEEECILFIIFISVWQM